MAAAAALRVEVVFVEDDALRAVQEFCVTRSVIVERAVGFASVAEAAALAAAGPGGRLVLRRVQRGGATCALAEEA